MQLTQELSQKKGESSVHANRDFSYLRRQTLRFISIRQRKHEAEVIRRRGRRHGVATRIILFLE